MIPKLFVMLKWTEVEIKKEHQVLMVNKITVSRKGQRDIRGTSRRMASKLPLSGRSRKLDPSLK